MRTHTIRRRLSFIAFTASAAIALACATTAPPPVRVPQPSITPSYISEKPESTEVLALTPGSIGDLRRAADQFIRFWRYHWELSAGYRIQTRITWGAPAGIDSVVLSAEDSIATFSEWRGTLIQADVDRNTLIHCHPDTPFDKKYPRVEAYVIESGVGARAVCPSWHPFEKSPPWDERRGIDESIIRPLRQRVRDERARLLALLDSGAAQNPEDGWIAGQRVRFALDQGDTAQAARAVAECGAASWWCLLLDGYVAHARGDFIRAEDTFLASIAAMPERERCDWSNVDFILEGEGRAAYSGMSCAEQDSANRNIWWLLDPLYTEPGNDRRAEHMARRVLVALRSATSVHERWDMRDRGGGWAITEMLMRYGWPDFSHWSGQGEDRSHFGYLRINDSVMFAHGRFATAEYSGPRYSLVPSWSAVTEPFKAREYDWALTEAAHYAVFPEDTIYWPVEHYDRKSGPLLQIWTQHGLFRRQDSVLLATSTHLYERDFLGTFIDTLRGNLILSEGPESMRSIPAKAAVGRTNVLRSMVPARPQLVSLELRDQAPRGVAARSRFGIEPPATLSSMAPGEIGVSSAVFIRPLPDGRAEEGDPSNALSRMYGSAVFANTEPVGLYWETYGVVADDSLQMTISVVRNNPRSGLLRRIGLALRLAAAPSGGVSVSWRETSPRNTVVVHSGSVPIQGRIVTLDISSLPPASYTITMSIARPGGVPVSAERDFFIADY